VLFHVPSQQTISRLVLGAGRHPSSRWAQRTAPFARKPNGWFVDIKRSYVQGFLQNETTLILFYQKMENFTLFLGPSDSRGGPQVYM